MRFLTRFLQISVFVVLLHASRLALCEGQTDSNFKPNNFIDSQLAILWNSHRVEPASVVTDAQFLRRASLHLTGRIPQPEEVRRFVRSQDPRKREKKIDELLASPHYAPYWARVWRHWLNAEPQFGQACCAIGEFSRAEPKNDQERIRGWAVEQLEAGLRCAHRENEPLDQLVKSLLLAKGDVRDIPEVGFYTVHDTPVDASSVMAEMLLGADLSCARCHKHPNGRWDTPDYLALESCFDRLQLTNTINGGMPRINLAIEMRTVDGEDIEVSSKYFGNAFSKAVRKDSDPRAAIVDWLSGPGKRHFARSMVNHYWHHLFGYGLIDPIYRIDESDLGQHAELLERLSQQLIDDKFDAKKLLRRLCNSRAYQLGGEQWTQETKLLFNSHRQRICHQTRPWLLYQAFDTQAPFEATYKRSTHALHSSDGCTRHGHHATETPSATPMPFADAIYKLVSAKDNRLHRLLEAGKSDEEILEHLALATLARPLSDEEKAQLKSIAKTDAWSKLPRKQKFERIFLLLGHHAEFLSFY